MQTTIDLLQLWLEIFQEAIQLCDSIDGLPDRCECGDADAHLEGRCPCCREHVQQTEPHGHTESCTVLLARLRAELNIFCQDFTRMAAPIEASGVGKKYLELRRGIFLAADDLHQIVKTVDRVHEEVAGFRRSCDLPELRSLKGYSTDLREHLNRLQLNMTQG